MGKYLKINLDEVRRLKKWFRCAIIEGAVVDDDYHLDERLQEFIYQEKEGQGSGKSIRKSYLGK